MTPVYLMVQAAAFAMAIGVGFALGRWTALPHWADAILAVGTYLVVTYGIAAWRSGPSSTWPTDGDDY